MAFDPLANNSDENIFAIKGNRGGRGPGGFTSPGGGGGFTSFAGFGGGSFAPPGGLGGNDVSIMLRKRPFAMAATGAPAGLPGGGTSMAAPQMTGPSTVGPQAPAAPQGLLGLLHGALMQGQGGMGGYGQTPSGTFNYNPGGDQRNAGYWVDAQGVKRDAKGNVVTFDPNNPWGSFSGNLDPTTLGALQRLAGQFGAAGAFDPSGSQSYLDSILGGAQTDANALTTRNQNALDLSGLDPAQAAAYKLTGLQSTNRGVQDIMANARSGAAQNAQQFGQHVLDQLFGQQSGWLSADQQAHLQQYLQQQGANVARQGQFGNTLGGLLGTAGGAWLAPGGLVAGHG